MSDSLSSESCSDKLITAGTALFIGPFLSFCTTDGLHMQREKCQYEPSKRHILCLLMFKRGILMLLLLLLTMCFRCVLLKQSHSLFLNRNQYYEPIFIITKPNLLYSADLLKLRCNNSAFKAATITGVFYLFIGKNYLDFIFGL